MQTILSPVQMRELEQQYFRKTGSPSADLMLRAAAELVRAMDERGLVRGKAIAFVCGPGGNGGDGLAAAAICRKMGADCRVYLPLGAECFTGDALHYLQQLPADIPAKTEFDDAVPDVWVDALFGIGLNRPVTGVCADWIQHMRSSEAAVVSVDIPSGIDGRTGAVLGCAVQADVTVTFQHPKPGHFLQHGMDMCGELVLRDIGIPDGYLTDIPPLTAAHPYIRRITDEDVRCHLPKRRRFSHKTTYGHLLLIAGSRGMAGAAAIAARAALHSGAGLVTIACPADIVPVLQTLAPEAMCLPLPQNDAGALSADALPALRGALTGKTAIAAGPGLSRHAASEIVQEVLSAGIPAVIDADALNCIAAHPQLKNRLCRKHLITPHPGEAARLIQTAADPIADAIALSAMGCQVLLKGAASILYLDGGLYLSDSGSPCMAKGGSGDMLTGIAGALLAQGLPVDKAAIAACHAHGLAGEFAEAESGDRYPTAMNLIGMLPRVWQQLQ